VVKKNALLIQELLSKMDTYPAPTDLYLAASAARYNLPTYILTGNHKDFPVPLFERKAPLIIQKEKSLKLLYFLSLNKKMLTDSY